MRERDEGFAPTTLFILKQVTSLEPRQLVGIRKAFPKLASKRPKELRARIEGMERVVLGRIRNRAQADMLERSLLELQLPLELQAEPSYSPELVREALCGTATVSEDLRVELTFMPAFDPEAVIQICDSSPPQGPRMIAWSARESCWLRYVALEDGFDMYDLACHAPWQVDHIDAQLAPARGKLISSCIHELDPNEQSRDTDTGCDGITLGLGYRSEPGTWTETELWSPRRVDFPSTHRLFVTALACAWDLDFRPEVQRRWRKIASYLESWER